MRHTAIVPAAFVVLALGTVAPAAQAQQSLPALWVQPPATAADSAREAERAEKIRNLGFTPRITKLVLEHRVEPGMEMRMVALAWGKPSAEYEEYRDNGKGWRWEYPNGVYAFFVDGKLTRVQQVGAKR